MDNRVKDRTFVYLTGFKFFQLVLGAYCTSTIPVRYIWEDQLHFSLITFPTFTLLTLYVIFLRLCILQRCERVRPFETVASITGFLAHIGCFVSMLRVLPKVAYVSEHEVGKPTLTELARYYRTCSICVVCAVLACLYLLDGLLGLDVLLSERGLRTWPEPFEMNYDIDLPPSAPFQMRFPWETRLKNEFVVRKLHQIKVSQETYASLRSLRRQSVRYSATRNTLSIKSQISSFGTPSDILPARKARSSLDRGT